MRSDKQRIEQARKSVGLSGVRVKDPGLFVPAAVATVVAKTLLKIEKLERKIAGYELKKAKLELDQSKLDDRIRQIQAEIAKLR